MVGRDGDEACFRLLLLPRGALRLILGQLGRGATAIPDDLGHLHHLLLGLAIGHGEELVRGLPDLDRVRVGVGPLRDVIHLPAAPPEARHAHRRIEEGPEILPAGGFQAPMHLGVQGVPAIAVLPEPAIELQDGMVIRHDLARGEAADA